MRLVAGRGCGRSKRMGLWRTVRTNLMCQHPSDWHNNTGVIRQAEEQGMGVILMQPSGLSVIVPMVDLQRR